MKKNIYNHFNGKIFLVILLLIFAIVFFVYIQESELYKAIINGDDEYLKIAVSDATLYIYGFMLMIMIIQNSFTVIPLLLVITINITIFGFVKGFLWSWITSILAAIIIFMTVRYLFSNYFSSKISSVQLEKIENNGVSYVLIARIFPFIPTSLINIIGGLSTISLRKFIIGTAVGNFIYFFILALIPAGLLLSGINAYVIAAIIILFVAASYLLSKIKGKNNTANLIRNKFFRDGY